MLDWKVLVEHRWSLLDHFDRDGRRFVLACRNAPAALGGELLTPRERQVVLLAARGHSNKLIGYELGIATSVVGVLPRPSGQSPLGVKSRAALPRGMLSREEPQSRETLSPLSARVFEQYAGPRTGYRIERSWDFTRASRCLSSRAYPPTGTRAPLAR